MFLTGRPRFKNQAQNGKFKHRAPNKNVSAPVFRGSVRKLCASSSSQLEDRTAVPFSPRQSTTKVTLVKATKHKANPATDEVRVENRNHGLA